MRKSILITLIVGVVWSPAAVLSELTLAGVSIQPSSQGAKNPLSLEQKAEEIALLLPEGAKVAWFDPQGHGNLEKAILMVHAKESGSQPQVAVIYEKSSGKADISSQPLSLAIFSHRDGQLYKEWETELAGPQLWMQDGKSIGFQVVDVDADGKDEILTSPACRCFHTTIPRPACRGNTSPLTSARAPAALSDRGPPSLPPQGRHLNLIAPPIGKDHTDVRPPLLLHHGADEDHRIISLLHHPGIVPRLGPARPPLPQRNIEDVGTTVIVPPVIRASVATDALSLLFDCEALDHSGRTVRPL